MLVFWYCVFALASADLHFEGSMTRYGGIVLRLRELVNPRPMLRSCEGTPCCA